MLNHKIESPCFITRESIKLDMIKRGVQCIEAMHSGNNNFLGYRLNDKCFLFTNTRYGCQSDWPDLVRYVRKLILNIT